MFGWRVLNEKEENDNVYKNELGLYIILLLLFCKFVKLYYNNDLKQKVYPHFCFFPKPSIQIHYKENYILD
jgi:hypothetical protein